MFLVLQVTGKAMETATVDTIDTVSTPDPEPDEPSSESTETKRIHDTIGFGRDGMMMNRSDTIAMISDAPRC